MNCIKCNYPLDDNNSICPSCGTLNNSLDNSQNINNEQLIDLNSNSFQITQNNPNIDSNNNIVENIVEAPKLELLEDEGLGSNAQDMDKANISTYGELSEDSIKQSNSDITNEHYINNKSDIDFQIPSITTPVENISLPTDGSAPIIKENNETVGVVNKNNKIKVPKFKIKLDFKSVLNNRLAVLLIIVLFIIGLLLGKTIFSKNYCASSPSSVVKPTVTTKIPLISDGANNLVGVGEYQFSIPESYIYDKSDGGIIIYDKELNYKIFIHAIIGLYDDVASAKQSIKSSLEASGFQVNTINEIKVDEDNYLIVNGISNKINRTIAFRAGSHDYLFYIEIMSADNNYNNDLLKNANEIIKNAKYVEIKKGLEQNKQLNLGEIAVKASQEYKSLIAN